MTVQANRSKHGRLRTPIVLGILQVDFTGGSVTGAWDGLVWGTGCAVRWGGARVGQPGPVNTHSDKRKIILKPLPAPNSNRAHQWSRDVLREPARGVAEVPGRSRWCPGTVGGRLR